MTNEDIPSWMGLWLMRLSLYALLVVIVFCWAWDTFDQEAQKIPDWLWMLGWLSWLAEVVTYWFASWQNQQEKQRERMLIAQERMSDDELAAYAQKHASTIIAQAETYRAKSATKLANLSPEDLNDPELVAYALQEIKLLKYALLHSADALAEFKDKAQRVAMSAHLLKLRNDLINELGLNKPLVPGARTRRRLIERTLTLEQLEGEDGHTELR